jgi:hypothetical protein
MVVRSSLGENQGNGQIGDVWAHGGWLPILVSLQYAIAKPGAAFHARFFYRGV